VYDTDCPPFGQHDRTLPQVVVLGDALSRGRMCLIVA
jgi:hypothetical protein